MPSRAKIKYKLIDYQAFKFTTINNSGEEKPDKFMEIDQMILYIINNLKEFKILTMTIWHYLSMSDYRFICSYVKKGLSVVNDATSLNIKKSTNFHMKRPITNSSIEIKYNIDYLIVGSGLIMVCMNDSSIFCDDFYNLHLLHKVWQGYKENQQQNNMLNTKAFNITVGLTKTFKNDKKDENEVCFYSLSHWLWLWPCSVVCSTEWD